MACGVVAFVVGGGVAVLMAVPAVARPTGHEPMQEGREASAQVDPQAGPPGTALAVSGTCMFGTGVPATDVHVFLHPADPDIYWSTSVTLAIEPDGSFAGTLYITVDAPAGPHVLSTTCLADDQAFGVHEFDIEVAAGAANPNHVDVAPTQGPPGSAITVSGICMFTPDRPAARIFGYLQSASYFSDWELMVEPDGAFTGEVPVGNDAAPGGYKLVAACEADQQHYGQQAFDFQVLAATTTTDSPGPAATVPELPNTGDHGGGRLALTLGLVGGMAVAAAAARTQHRSPD